MKSIKLVFVAFSLIAIAFTSCKKSSDTKPTTAAGNNLALKLNGTAYTTSNVVAVDSAGYLQIIGIINSTTNVSLYILGGVKVGSFDLASDAGIINFVAGTSSFYTSTAGTITITSFTSNTVSGTFNFTGTNALNNATGTGTNGTFTSTYTTKN